MLIGIGGKSNTGKTTFFSAASLVDAEISNRIFTTIKPNKGVSYVRVPCACKKLGVKCNPRNSKCVDATRFIPVKLVDIAGLVPGAHLGKGLGNQFLSDIMEADALIHVVDISGGTDQDGNPVKSGSRDPLEDIKFFIEEIDYWMLGILMKVWKQFKAKVQAGAGKLAELIHKQLSGLGIGLEDVKNVIKKTNLNANADEAAMFKFVGELRKISKPILIAGNKIDKPASPDIFENVKNAGVNALPCSAESELALRRAHEHGFIKYSPGDSKFEVLKDPGEKQKAALEFIQKNVLDKFGSTGVQDIINKTVFELLRMIVVYPVENESKFSDSKGNVLPDAILLKQSSTLKDLAEKVHTTMAEKLLHGVDAVTKQRIGKDHELKNGDVIKIVFAK